MALCSDGLRLLPSAVAEDRLRSADGTGGITISGIELPSLAPDPLLLDAAVLIELPEVPATDEAPAEGAVGDEDSLLLALPGTEIRGMFMALLDAALSRSTVEKFADSCRGCGPGTAGGVILDDSAELSPGGVALESEAVALLEGAVGSTGLIDTPSVVANGAVVTSPTDGGGLLPEPGAVVAVVPEAAPGACDG